MSTPRHEPFRFCRAADLLKRAEALGVSLPFQDSTAPLFQTSAVSGTRIPNRMAVQPMEGCDASPAGAPGELAFRRYRRYAEGGSGLIWFEACSVSPEGRSNPRQLLLSTQTLDSFRQLVEMTRRAAQARFGAMHDPYLVLQITHSGRFSHRGVRSKPRAVRFNPLIDKSPGDVDIQSDAELMEIRDQFMAAAVLAEKAGFNAVDVKACHGYLLHELLSAITRTDSHYGGIFENRTRLLLDIVRQIRGALPQLALAVRLNATDGVPYPYGFGVSQGGTAAPDLSEPLRLQRLLVDAGCVLLNITAGIPFLVPHIGRPFEHPAKGAKRPDIHPLASVASLISLAAVFQTAQPSLPVVGTGYSWLRQFWPNVGAAVIEGKKASLIGVGRSSFAYPDAPADLMNFGALDPAKCCNTCSCCTDLMRSRQETGCVICDRSVYGRTKEETRK